MVTTESTPIPVEYPSLLEELKKELTQEPNKSLTAFCKEHSINYENFNLWLRTTGRSFIKLRSEIRVSAGMEKNSNELYLKCLDLLQIELNGNVHLRFVDFCERNKVSYRGMSNWLAGNNLDFTTIRARICEAKGVEIPKGCCRPYVPISTDRDKAKARFGKTLDTYREELASNLRYSLKVHCGKMGTDYYNMLRWMKFMKVSVRQLQRAARLNAKTCPDGKAIHVEECSVIELCTFLYTYDKDQRRK
ncbi:hypothetical protein FACS1894169_12990 [Bacteroidia bacterium]|nr:hypothetical protein FACS1894169_12990 [Bacteroidia bacterium]